MFTNQQKYPTWEQSHFMHVSQIDQNVEYKYIKIMNVFPPLIFQDNIEWESGDNRIVNLNQLKNAPQVAIEDVAFNNKSNPYLIQEGSIANFEEVKGIKSEALDISKLPAVPALPVSPNKKAKVETQNQFINELKQQNSQRVSWKQKLEIVSELVTNHKNEQFFPVSGLSIIAAYLYFVNSHYIKCVESGSHFRPNHHANLSYNLYKVLDNELLTAQNSFIIRSIKRNLPSFADQFMVSVPLTRIRDIAHRNDIPQDLKNEIKHRLQNKLHRCADPGDLKTCEELLWKARHGNYSAAFKHEFEIFYEELKEFFNAVGLEKLLDQIKYGFHHDSTLEPLIDKFLRNKHGGAFNDLSVITHLRQELLIRWDKLKDDDSKKSLYQQIQLADIELEQFLFVKISELLSYISINDISDVQRALRLAQVAAENMIISSLEVNELKIILNELNSFALQNGNSLQDPLSLLRLKSLLERGLRLANYFTNYITETFQANVTQLGKEFMINEQSVNVFSESLIRSHIMFQFSKSMEICLSFIRHTLNLPPFLIISSGVQQKAVGLFKPYDQLYESFGKEEVKEQKFVVFLENADGTEEIPKNVSAVFLRHNLPQLSHLAIRARQAKCLFICSENDNYYETMKQKASQLQNVQLKIEDEKLTLEQAPSKKQQEELVRKRSMNLLQILDKQTYEDVIEQLKQGNMQVNEEIAKTNREKEVRLLGSKSVHSLKLQELAQKSKLFRTPTQISIPVTIPLYLLLQDQSNYTEYTDQGIVIDTCNFELIQQHINYITEFLKEIFLADKGYLGQMCQAIQQAFNKETNLVAVRSSSTLEDLSQIAGAGLFESFLNVKLKNEDELSQAIANVWLSLFTERAVVSRKQYGISSSKAHMAVLVQQQIYSDFSFVIHTENPITQNSDEILIEIAVGLGETLASANQTGSPYSLLYNKTDKKCEIRSFANYQFGLFANEKHTEPQLVEVDYSKIEFSENPKFLLEMGEKLGEIGMKIEDFFEDQAQDIEGAIIREGNQFSIYIVQTRDQIH